MHIVTKRDSKNYSRSYSLLAKKNMLNASLPRPATTDGLAVLPSKARPLCSFHKFQITFIPIVAQALVSSTLLKLRIFDHHSGREVAVDPISAT